ncbi:MAG TPA: DUF1697 domain-containing protein [Verrucomicrobiae bacterium]|jgi:uncharacterized protein (DUF1697 family)|nr:DUF1697 domain-containing protein [Verrucomicrobiae bacterium]
MAKYVAFLRGINVGGNKMVKMDDLKRAFEALKFQNVKTLLASGNVLFETANGNDTGLGVKIAEKLKSVFGFEVGVLVRSIEELQRLADSKPFEKIKATPQTRLYTTFLSEKPKIALKIPFKPADKDFRILRASKDEVCIVLTLSPSTQTIDLMAFLDKHFGRQITTRNWNTIVKILKG